MKYDGSLHMLIEEPREPDIQHLRWLRWLVLFGHLDDADKAGEMVGASSQQAREDEGA